jgi:hypothetical protein
VAKCLEAYRACVVHGPPLNEVPYGIAYWIGRLEFVASPFSGDYKAIKARLDESRAWVANDYLNSVQAVVAWIFRYKPEELEQWSADKLFRRFAQAEYLLGRPMEPADPHQTTEEPADGQKKKKPLDPRVAKILERKRRNAAAGLK